jgi:hypothetical protein
MRYAILVLVPLVALLAACGDDDGGAPASPTLFDVPTRSAGPTPTVTPTPSPANALRSVSADDARVVAAVGQAGFAEFAEELANGVEKNSLEFFVQHAAYEEFECTNVGGFPAPPRNCLGQPDGTLVPAIGYGIWQSEGGYSSPEQYAEFIAGRIAGKSAPDAYMYALGHHVRSADESDEGIDLVVADVGCPSPEKNLLPSCAVVFRVAEVDGAWAIVGVTSGSVELVDVFFDWWAPWSEVFPP